MRPPDTNNSRPSSPAPRTGLLLEGLGRAGCAALGAGVSSGLGAILRLAPHPQGLGVPQGLRFSPGVVPPQGSRLPLPLSRPTTGGRLGAPPSPPRVLHLPSRPARQEAPRPRRREAPLGVVVPPAGSHRPQRLGLAGGARATGLQVPPRPARHRGGNGGGGACARRPPCGPRRVNNKGLLGGGGGGRREACPRARWRAAPPRPGRRAPPARCRRSPRSRSTTRT